MLSHPQRKGEEEALTNGIFVYTDVIPLTVAALQTGNHWEEVANDGMVAGWSHISLLKRGRKKRPRQSECT